MRPTESKSCEVNQWGRPFRDGPIFNRTKTPRQKRPPSKQPHDQQQHDGADRRIDDLGYETDAEVDAEPWKQQARDKGAGDTDENIADDAKAGAAHDLSGKPARNQADE